MKNLFLLCVLVFNQALAQSEPAAGSWKTWVISSGKEFRLPPPPDKKSIEAEVKQLQVVQSKRDAEATKKMLYWNAGAPGYRWTQLATQLSSRGVPPFRTLALLHVAIYDATIAAWDSKYTYNRPRPSNSGGRIKTLVTPPDSPSYPCEHSVVASAAAAVLSYLFPQQADTIQMLARQAGESRLMAGVAYPSDVESGFDLGRKVAEKVIVRARKDRSEAVWKGKLPNKPGLWNGTNPVGANFGNLKPWVLDSSSQFRPAPPPDFAKDMEELKRFKPTQQATARAFYHATQDFWSDVVNDKIFEYNLHTNPPRAARVYALKSIAAYDAFVACWEAKYTYWGIRPSQYDTTFKQTLGLPPFPGYPSGHATTSSSVATILTYLFPADSQYFVLKAEECAESRFEGGIHFRTDNVVGLEMGRKVGEEVTKRAKADGADEAPALVRKR